MTYLEWLIIILVYLAAYGLWSAFETYRERAPYRSRGSRRATKFVVLTLVLVGLGAAYNSAAVKGFFQSQPAEVAESASSEAPINGDSGALGVLGTQPVPEEPVDREVELPSPPSITPAPTPSAPQTFNVTFQSDPPGAALYLGSERVGVTPIELSLSEDETLLYTLRAEEGVPNHRLYHPYSSTLTPTRDASLSVWLERLNAEEVAALQRRNAGRPVHLERVSANTTRYRVVTDCSEGVDLTYMDKAQRIVQESGRKDGWAYGFIPKPGQFLYLYAKSNCASGTLNVQLIQDGEVLLENTATGRDSIATISTYW